MKQVLFLLLFLLLSGCYEDDDDTKSTICDQYGCVTCKTTSNWDNTKFETKCTGTGKYSAMYNGDDGVIVEETTSGIVEQ